MSKLCQCSRCVRARAILKERKDKDRDRREATPTGYQDPRAWRPDDPLLKVLF